VTTTSNQNEVPESLLSLFERTAALRQQYLAATPWPHVVVHNAFPDSLLDEAAEECARVEGTFVSTTNHHRQIKEEASDGLGPSTRRVLELVDSQIFRDFLSAVTGVQELYADPAHRLAGIHRTRRDGFSKIHRDFRIHPTNGMVHRLNVLVYLNRDWPGEYGGNLEMWPKDMSALGRSVAPLFNTMVFWESDARTLHGLPDPVTCPPDRMRLSIAAYFYTKPDKAGRVEKIVHYYSRPGEDHAIVLHSVADRLRLLVPKRVVSLTKLVRHRS